MYLSGGSRSPRMFVVVLHQMLRMCISKGALLYFVLHVMYIPCTLSGGGLLLYSVFHVICYILCARVEVGYTECTGGGGLQCFMLYVIYCVHGWRWAILSARVEVGFSVLCYMLYTACTGGGGLQCFMLYVIYCVHGWRWAILSARVEVGFSVLCYMLYIACTGGGGLY